MTKRRPPNKEFDNNKIRDILKSCRCHQKHPGIHGIVKRPIDLGTGLKINISAQKEYATDGINTEKLFKSTWLKIDGNS